ncbi:MAG: hypothetical protein GX207_07870 [Peptococcaceae bacterium]|nr:hypothetical protein [Peptococcaceae bacterium]
MLLEFLLALSIRFFLFDFILFKRIRNYLKQKGYFFRKLFSCPFCQGFWCGLAVYLYYHGFSLSWAQISQLLAFGFISAYLGLITAVALEPLINIYEKNSDLPLK